MKALLWPILFGLLLGIVLFYSIPAHATEIQNPSICVQFDTAPTFATVNAVMESLTANGRDVNTAANILVATVEKSCPQHLSLLQAYVDAGVFLYPELKR